jgi:atypical dual specificity phosphatase
VQADDNESFELRKYFNQAANFIRDALQRTNVMVHCLAGVSRSVSLVIAYLIKHCGKSYSEAYSLLKSKRRVIQPNSGFVAQLKQYEQEQAQVGSNNEVLARRYER